MQHLTESSKHVDAARARRAASPVDLLTPLTIALGIAVGVWMLWAGAVNIVATTLNTFLHRDYSISSFSISAADGPVLSVRRSQNGVGSEYRMDIDGNQLPPVDTNNENAPVMTSRMATLFGLPTHPRPVDLLIIACEEVPSSSKINEVWYLVQSRNPSEGCWLECWSIADYRGRCYLGTAGRTASAPPPEQRFQIPDHRRNYSQGWMHFDGSGWLRYSRNASVDNAAVYLAASDTIFKINLIELSVQELARAPENLISMRCTTPYMTGPNSLHAVQTDQRCLTFRTDRQLIEMDLSGAVTRTVSLDGIPLKSHVTYLETSGDEGQTIQRFLWWDTSTRIDSGNSVETHYATISEAGEHSVPQTVRWQDHNAGLRLAEVRTAMGCGLLSPLMMAGAELFRPSIQQGQYRTSPVAATACALLTLLSIGLMWRHSGQHVVAFRKTWLMFVLLLGPFGYLGYRCHRQWTGVRRNKSIAEPPVSLPTIIAA